MRERGFVLASARILRRAWQIYVAHIFLFTIFMAEIAYVAATFENPLYAEEMKILDFLKQPDVTIFQALLLKFKPVNMDVLPLYIVLLLLFPPMLLMLLRHPNVALGGSALVYAFDLAARLEFAGLSERRLVLQSVCLAAVVRLRRMVRAWRGAKTRRRSALERGACRRYRLSGVRLLGHADLARSNCSIVSCPAGWRIGCIRSIRPISMCCGLRISWRSPPSPSASCRGIGRA